MVIIFVQERHHYMSNWCKFTSHSQNNVWWRKSDSFFHPFKNADIYLSVTPGAKITKNNKSASAMTSPIHNFFIRFGSQSYITSPKQELTDAMHT